MHLKNKRPESEAARDVWRELDRLSKSALIDLYAQALATMHGHADSPVTLAEVVEDAIPMLELRKDRVPNAWRSATKRPA